MRFVAYLSAAVITLILLLPASHVHATPAPAPGDATAHVASSTEGLKMPEVTSPALRSSEGGSKPPPDSSPRPVTKVRTWALENDAWGRVFHPTDRDYTMGVPVSESISGLPEGDVWNGLLLVSHRLATLTRVDSDRPLSDREVSTTWMWGNATFTPKDITDPAPIHDDRPYASLLYAGAGYTRENAFPDSMLPTLSTDFQIGVLGTGVSRAVQTDIHKICCPDKLPGGWNNQIGAGGSPTFLYSQTFRSGFQRLTSPDLDQLVRTSFSWNVGYDIGYHVDVRTAATFAIARTSEDLRLALSSAAPIAADAPNTLTAAAHPLEENATGLAAYARVGLQAMAYNELMQGAWTGRNAVTVPWNQGRHFLADATVGVDLSWMTGLACDAWTLLVHRHRCSSDRRAPDIHYYLVQSWRSRDLRDGSEGSHYWGGLRFTYDMD
jgi:Uncharacterized protein conserved in bacteria (DUF2219)